MFNIKPDQILPCLNKHHKKQKLTITQEYNAAAAAVFQCVGVAWADMPTRVMHEVVQNNYISATVT